uniref:Protein DA1-like domain-containing protein n=1 Tax=Helianthus annuus TaxID=4232 RepID=A0A251SQK0_HELAN
MEKRMQTECKEFNVAIIKEKNVIITRIRLRLGQGASKELTIASVLKRPRIDGSWFVGMRTRHHKLTCRCEVTAILVLYVFRGCR